MVKQKATSDCFLACLAMVTDQDYEKMFNAKFCAKIESEHGVYGKDIEKAFDLAGLTSADYRSISIPLTIGTNGMLKVLLWGRRAILQVPSLNFENGHHAIFWTGEEVLDPSNKQVYHWLSGVNLEHVWIFEER